MLGECLSAGVWAGTFSVVYEGEEKLNTYWWLYFKSNG